MNKILIIARREFLSRVQKKTFLLTTIGLPILIFGIYGLIIYFTIKTTDNFTIAVADNANVFDGKINQINDAEINFVLVQNETPETLTTQVNTKKINAFVFIPKTFDFTNTKDSIQIVSEKSIGIMTREKIHSKLNGLIEEKRMLSSLNITKHQLDSLQKGNAIIFTSTKGVEDSNNKAGISYGVGFVSGFLIYIILFIYGTMVMRGVMEEKTNRIAEVIVSSVKPFQLMLGKILGIGLVCLTQILLWIFFILIIYNVTKLTGKADAMSSVVGGIQDVFTSSNMPLILSCFVFYLLGGFFFYASLFAAVGSAVNEDMREAQSLSFPLMMPIIFSVAMMTAVLKDPTGSLAFWGSIIPFSSPIIMMVRLPFGVPGTVPWWQLGLSMSLLIAGFIFTTWFAGKIYRTGILMYGKKPSWKEIIKWAFRKN